MSKAERTRQAILDTALERFASFGFEGTRLTDIADPLGITRAALYYHFAGKHELLEALVHPYLEAAEHTVKDIATPASDDERWQALRDTADLLLAEPALVRWIERDPAVRHHPDIGPRLASHASRLREVVAGSTDEHDLVRASAAIGALRRPILFVEKPDVATLADELVAAAGALVGLTDP